MVLFCWHVACEVISEILGNSENIPGPGQQLIKFTLQRKSRHSEQFVAPFIAAYLRQFNSVRFDRDMNLNSAPGP